jgi:hypothetical protein
MGVFACINEAVMGTINEAHTHTTHRRYGLDPNPVIVTHGPKYRSWTSSISIPASSVASSSARMTVAYPGSAGRERKTGQSEDKRSLPCR